MPEDSCDGTSMMDMPPLSKRKPRAFLQRPDDITRDSKGVSHVCHLVWLKREVRRQTITAVRGSIPRDFGGAPIPYIGEILPNLVNTRLDGVHRRRSKSVFSSHSLRYPEN